MPAPNITWEFIKRLINNGSSIQGSAPEWYDGFWALGGVVGMYTAKKKVVDPMIEFRNKVRAGGDWDFKSNWLKPHKDSGVEVAGKVYRYDMPGNFHYGYVGA